MENNKNKDRELSEQELENAVGGRSDAFKRGYQCRDCGAVCFSEPAGKKCPNCGGDVLLRPLEDRR